MRHRIPIACQACRGFSLLEMTAALCVLSLGLFGAIQMYHTGTEALRNLRDANLAVTAIHNELETLRTLPFDSLPEGDTGDWHSRSSGVDALPDASPRVAVRNVADGCPGLKEVTVSIAWLGPNGRQITKSVTTLIADKGIAP